LPKEVCQRSEFVHHFSGANGVVFVGGLHAFANRDALDFFCQSVLPEIRARLGNVQVRFVGRAAGGTVKLFRENFGIELTGYVRDVRPYVQSAACYVVPLRVGGGTRVKILDAWNWGVPVVTTRIGAEGIRVKDDENVLVANTPDDFARAVVRLLKTPDLASRLIRSGFQAVRTHYDWRSAYSAWDDVYQCEYCSSRHTRPA